MGVVPTVGEALGRVGDAGFCGELRQRAPWRPDQTQPRWQLAKGTERGLGQEGRRGAVVIQRAVQFHVAHPDADRRADPDQRHRLGNDPAGDVGLGRGDGDAPELKPIRIGWMRAGGDTSQGAEFQGFAHGFVRAGVPATRDVRRADVPV